ncbi:hypothetical protein JF546_02380 [Nitratireductor aquimarinus]|uniref:hypothetical protein n=1 Tax=Nitratireductor aquimarinus TaxID=889300 RepID=UPI001A8FBDB9|nr:hypothetical protein [Nitratireductor aquimarinus]MBN8241855.1 hypothetical protein [Nitratireductor aquimarinus]MBY6130241.1 hypothetical protein [Nitratireductor aquimarinus]MCA1305130.1 hypothetical protein [Nitratireductor aquimarinus]
MPNYLQMGYYETGTASIEQGQKVVTGQGTAWSQIVRRGDDFGKHVGRPIPIASVDSDTQITLAFPWPGPTQAAAPYRVTFTPYHVAYRQALQEIGQLLSSGNVSALAGLVGANGKFPAFDGAGSMILEDLSNYAGTGNVKGPAVAVGDNVALFDGATGKLIKDGFSVSAFMRTLLDDSDGPAAYGTLGTVPAAQIPGNLTPDKAFRRGNVLGTVSQSGGVPTGAVIERGINANGEYVRFADGTQICTTTKSVSLASAAYHDFPYPAAFTGDVFGSWSTVKTQSGANVGVLASCFLATSGAEWSFRVNSSGGSAVNIYLDACGRWF